MHESSSRLTTAMIRRDGPLPRAETVRPRVAAGDDAADPIAEVGRMVEAVLAELRSPASQRREPTVVRLVDRLVSLRRVETVPPGTRFLEVLPGTVVTPLARDHLRRMGIELRLGSRTPQDRGTQASWRFAIERTCECGTTMALRRALLEGSEVWAELEAELEVVASWLTEGMERGVFLLTAEASLAVWRACRFPGVRAAAASDADQVARAVRVLGVNLLVTEPAGRSISWLKHLAGVFRGGGPPHPPPGLLAEADA